MPRIHVTGASGSGTTTLGAALAVRLCCAHFDADDFFWLPTDPPYRGKREPKARNELLIRNLSAHRDWVQSGSLTGWESGAERLIDRVVYLLVPTELRIARLRAREEVTFGAEAIAPGGSQHELFLEFIDWAERYDTAGLEQRSRATHEAWLRELSCPVLRISGEHAVEDCVGLVLKWLGAAAP
jgi:adenylate kinase family enzyme